MALDGSLVGRLLLGSAVALGLSCASETNAPGTRSGSPTGVPGGEGEPVSDTTTGPVLPPDIQIDPQDMQDMPSNNDVDDADVCDEDVYMAEPKRLDMYMIVDDSASMLPWWPATTDAINQFFQDPGSAGVGVGVQFFGEECDPNFYATPSVPIAPLPGNMNALQTAFPLLPLEGTATVPAMQGAVQHARQWATQHPDSKTVILLVTDGLPADCNSTVEGVVDVIAEGLSGSPSIQTFVIGIGIGLLALNDFAAAGGTGQALLVEAGVAQELVTALNDIRGAALPCDYALPDGNGNTVDPKEVNLSYTAPGATESTPIGWVPTSMDCDPLKGGWYYDNAAAPSRLIACDQSCGTLKDAGGQVSVVLGCPTVEIDEIK